MGLMLLIAAIIAAALLLAWTTARTSHGRSPGIRWRGIDWSGARPRPDDAAPPAPDEPNA
jgi:hypothetical protein